MTLSLTEELAHSKLDARLNYIGVKNVNKNVGSIDRAIRAILGIIAIALYALGTLQGTLGLVALIVGIVLLGTAAIGWCPPYAIFGISTCKVKK